MHVEYLGGLACGEKIHAWHCASAQCTMQPSNGDFFTFLPVCDTELSSTERYLAVAEAGELIAGVDAA